MSGKRVAMGVGFSWLLSASRLVVNLVLMAFYYHYLPPAMLGLWLSFAALAAFLAVSDLGLNFTTSRALGYMLSRRLNHGAVDPGLSPRVMAYPVEDLLATVSRAYVILGAAMFVVALALGQPYLSRLGLSPELQAEAWRAWVLYGLGFCFALAASTPNYALQGLGDLGLDAAIQAVALWLGMAVTVFGLRAGWGIDLLAAVYLGQTLLTRAALWHLLKKRHAWLFQKPGRFQGGLLRALYRESRGMFITQVGAMLAFQAAPLLIVSLLGPEALPDYNSAWVLALYGNQLGQAIPPALAPFIAQRRAAGDFASVRRMLSHAMKATWTLQLIYASLVLVLAPLALELWLGPGHFVGHAFVVFFVLQNLLDQQHASIGFFAWNTGYWPFGRWSLLGGALTWIFIATGLSLLGLKGAALGALLAQVLTSNWVIPWGTLRHVGFSLSGYGREVLARVLPLGLLCLGVAYGLSRLQGPAAWATWQLRGVGMDRLSVAALTSLVVLSLGLFCAWKAVLSGEERDVWIQRWRKWRSRNKGVA